MVTFVNQLYLAALLAIAVPVLAHLVRRRSSERVIFPAAMLLVGSAEQVRRRSTLVEKLLLALRVLLIAAIVLAFARPRLLSAKASKGRLLGSVAIVVDDTPSMGASLRSGSDRTRMQEAREAVLTIIDRLQDGSRVRLQTSGSLLLDGETDLDVCRRTVRALEVGEDARPMGAALAEAAGWLRSEMPPRELFVISDFQRTSWRDAGGVRLLGMAVTAVALGARLEDWAVLELAPVEGRAYAGLPFELRARVRSSRGGSREAQLLVPGRPLQRRMLQLLAGVEEEVSFELVAPTAGPLSGELVLVGSDDWPANDRRLFAVNVSQLPRVLCVGGGRGDLASELIWRALAPFPGGEHARALAERTSSPLGDAKVLSRYDCVFLCSPSMLTERDWKELVRFVEDGGGLAAFADAGMADEVFWARGCALLGSPSGEVRPSDGPVRLSGCDFKHPLLRAFAGGMNGNIEGVEFYRFLRLERPHGAVLAHFSGDTAAPAILTRSVGRGRVIVFAFSPVPSWSSLFKEGSFVPLVHEAVAYLARTDDLPQVLVGGAPVIELHPSERGCEVVATELGRPSGDELAPRRSLKRLMAAQETLTVGLGRLPRRGLVRLSSRREGFERERVLAVELDPAESDQTAVDASSALGLGVRVVRSSDELAAMLDHLHGGLELEGVFAWAALALFVAELFMSWRLTRVRSAGLPNLRGAI